MIAMTPGEGNERGWKIEYTLVCTVWENNAQVLLWLHDIMANKNVL